MKHSEHFYLNLMFDYELYELAYNICYQLILTNCDQGVEGRKSLSRIIVKA